MSHNFVGWCMLIETTVIPGAALVGMFAAGLFEVGEMALSKDVDKSPNFDGPLFEAAADGTNGSSNSDSSGIGDNGDDAGDDDTSLEFENPVNPTDVASYE